MEQSIYTDLALERMELATERSEVTEGIVVEEDVDYDGEVKITTVRVLTPVAEKRIGRSIGTYITLEIPNVHRFETSFHPTLAQSVTDCLKRLDVWDRKKVLLVGIGNREITSDSLGPACVQETIVNRHFHVINKEKDKYSISAIAPGVMAQTGMESLEIIRGVIHETKPELVIAIDALAARSITRVNTTIQICDTGITPGSGLGNHRMSLNQETLGIPCIAIGVPTVVSTVTIVADILSEIASNSEEAAVAMRALETDEYPQRYHELYVTTKNVDEEIQCLSRIISRAIELCYELIEEEM